MILGRFGKGAGYTDKAFEFKSKEVQEALELVSGAKGAENLQCFNLVVTQTCKRLAVFVYRFATTLQRRVQADWHSQSGFYAPNADLDELVYVPAGLGIHVPILRREVVISETSADELVQKYMLLSRVFSKYGTQHQ